MIEVVPAALAGERLDRVVAMLTGASRSQVDGWVADGSVRVNGRAVTARAHRLAEGDEVAVDVPARPDPAGPPPDAGVDVPLVHVDDDVVVVDKPAGVVVHPGSGRGGGTLVQGLLTRFPELAGVGGDPQRPGVVHRLDRDTSGLMVVARTPAAHGALVADLAARRVRRRYLALVWGAFEVPQGAIDAPIGRSARRRTRMAVSASGREARTRYQVERVVTDPVLASLVSLELETGRTHQIRVHLQAVGHPVVGDPWYQGRRASLEVPRLFLHATELSFAHPATGEELTFTSPLPDDLAGVLDRLR